MAGKLQGKRYDAKFVAEAGEKFETHACDYLLAVDVAGETLDGFKAANWERGFGDFHCKPDWDTLRVAGWQDGAAVVLCDLVDPKTHELVAHGPRTMLKRQLERARAAGYGVDCASELEYYVYETGYREAFDRGYRGLRSSGWYREDYNLLQGTRTEPLHLGVREALQKTGVRVEGTKGEFGVGQHELNILYSDALRMADTHALFKFCMKAVADAQGRSVTFMAKPTDDAGSSCHLHTNLTDAVTGANKFAEDRSVFDRFLAGWIRYTPDFMVFTAPTINSYKRYRLGSWAPTRLAWSDDNRTAGFRVVGNGKALRIENRLPGADVNPYTVFAGSIAAGLQGLVDGNDAGPPFHGNIYEAADLPLPPMTLRDAVNAFKSSKIAEDALTADVRDHYVNYFEKEVQAFQEAVTDWEVQRYFEHI